MMEKNSKVRKLVMRSTILLLCCGFLACKTSQLSKTVLVKNTLDFSRKEVVSLKVDQLKPLLKRYTEASIRMRNAKTGEYLVTQWLDSDEDGKSDELLFQVEVNANGTSKYLLLADSTVKPPAVSAMTYSRFVPERTDDYAWENDKVAFRVYGPDAQQRVEQHRENGTLSSGVDLWLKRTDLPVINKWYKGYLTDPSFYHTDRGEGYDPYHVGASRGVGGSGIWEGDSLHVSKNFVRYKTIATGPLRTVFELSYAPWSRYQIRETKRISLDLGSNFSKFDVHFDSDQPIPNYTVGITLHKNEGEARLERAAGYFWHHEQIDGVFLGEGIVLNPATVDTAFVHRSNVPDQSNLLIAIQPSAKISYYAGFAWAKSGQVANAADWDRLLQQQALRIAQPLVVRLK